MLMGGEAHGLNVVGFFSVSDTNIVFSSVKLGRLNIPLHAMMFTILSEKASILRHTSNRHGRGLRPFAVKLTAAAALKPFCLVQTSVSLRIQIMEWNHTTQASKTRGYSG